MTFFETYFTFYFNILYYYCISSIKLYYIIIYKDLR